MIAKIVDERGLNAKGREKLDVLVSPPTVAFSLAFYTSLMLAVDLFSTIYHLLAQG